MPMKTALDYAWEYVARGWCIFPIIKGGKKPLVKWRTDDLATNDINQIKKWAKVYPNCNWAIDMLKSNICVIDVDNKGTQTGSQTLEALAREGKIFPETVTVKSPTLGFHIYLDEWLSNRNLGNGLDLRANGYVLLPGSITVEGLIGKDDKPGVYGETASKNGYARAPEWLKTITGAPNRIENENNLHYDHSNIKIKPDQQQNVFNATEWLFNAPISDIEDSGGWNAVRVAAGLSDYALTVDKAFHLMTNIWNPKCKPPWEEHELDDLYGKVERGIARGKDTWGIKTPDWDFAVEEPDIWGESQKKIELYSSIPSDFSIPKREWVMGRTYLAGYLTLTSASPGVGKSFLTMLEAVSIANNIALTGEAIHKQGKVWLYNAEDDTHEIMRRFHAVFEYYDLDPKDAMQNIVITTADKPLPHLINKDMNPNRPLIDQIKEQIIKDNIVLWIIDPLVETHELNENDNTQMSKLMNIYREIVKETRCALGPVHHDRKKSSVTKEKSNPETARGASALIGAARIVRNLNVMADDEADLYHIPSESRRQYFRSDIGKINVAKATDNTKWFKIQSKRIFNGDNVGVIIPADIKKINGDLREKLQNDIINIYDTEGDYTIKSISKKLKDLNLGIKSYQTLKRKMEIIFKEEVFFNDLSYKLGTIFTNPNPKTAALIVRKVS